MGVVSSEEAPSTEPSDAVGNDTRRLSYKFQRLRERIRAAIEAGELAGKLPGERSLARQFNVNAKTLSKALTDLAAEGVLERNIGLGTFVRDGTTAPSTTKILLLCDPDQIGSLTAALAARQLDVQAHPANADLAPSLLAPFDLVLVSSPNVSDAVVRDLIVRGKTVVSVDRLSQPYSTHSIVAHHAMAAAMAARDLVALGHRKLLLVPENPSDADLLHEVGQAIPQARCEIATARSIARAAADGSTGVVCDSRLARDVLRNCHAAGLSVPDALSVVAYGRLSEDAPCCGHFVSDERVVDALTDLLTVNLPHRPVTLWLTAESVARGTTAAPRR